MFYKAFAATVLIAAPLIVIAVQTVLPSEANRPDQPALAMPGSPFEMAASPPAGFSPPPPDFTQSPAPSLPFGQPMSEAGKPMLGPNMGLHQQMSQGPSATMTTGPITTGPIATGSTAPAPMRAPSSRSEANHTPPPGVGPPRE